jgi:tRNA threonylcarbamoyladenosine biosynthesis protein TsaB
VKILAVNTANTLLSVALADGEKLVHLYESEETRDQGNLLLKHVQTALETAQLAHRELDLLAVVTGPGSFTGIRIGLATMRAMAMAAGVPVIGISSFDLFAAPKDGHANIICVESWRDELYFQVNGAAGDIALPPVNVTPEDFMPKLSGVAGPYILSGDAAGKMKGLLPDAVLNDAKTNAAHVARVAARKFSASGKTTERPVPFYLREADVTMAK